MQGLGAAAAVPAALALIGSIYPPGAARTRALSLLAAMASVGIMSGLLIGGVVLLGWRWVFLLMAPLAVAAAVAAPRVLPEARADYAARPAVLFGLTRVEHGVLPRSPPSRRWPPVWPCWRPSSGGSGVRRCR